MGNTQGVMGGINRQLEIRNQKLNLVQAGAGPALLLLHGFTGSSASWQKHCTVFAKDYRVIAPDALGHGQSASPNNLTRYTFEELAADFVALLDNLEIEKTALLGYSMGGRMALYFALQAPERISQLILESASPGLADPAERQARVASDEALAYRIERWGLEAFVDYWENLPLWESQRNLPEATKAAQRAARLNNDPCGLANSLRGAGTGVQPSLWDRLPELTVPTLLIAGELDAKFSVIARQMLAKLPQAYLALVPGAGHTVHLEQPDQFNQLVLNFLANNKERDS